MADLEQRNKDITIRVLNGETITSLAKKNGISTTRARQIFWGIIRGITRDSLPEISRDRMNRGRIIGSELNWIRKYKIGLIREINK